MGCKPRQRTPFTGLSSTERYRVDADFAQRMKDKTKKRYHTDPDFAKQVKERSSKRVKVLYHTDQMERWNHYYCSKILK
jgi:hypothetical protein